VKRGVCKLCRLDRELVRSHLIPAALYRYLEDEHMSPVRVGNGFVIPTDRQTKDHLLCSSCEDVLSKGGESWAAPTLARMSRIFPLFDLITSQPAAFDDGDGGMYFTANNPAIKTDALTHFAVGIFWKASVHSWKEDKRESMIDLGRYSEDLRHWLLGGTAFPENTCLGITVSPPARAQITLLPPVESSRKEWRTFWMHLLGVLFTLEVGSQIGPEMREGCFYRNANHPIMVSNSITDVLERKFSREYLESRKTRAYLSAKAKRSQKRTQD
jgi:hypothetical protein